MSQRAKRLVCTLGHVDFDALLNTLAHTLAELHVKKPADKLCDVKVLALVVMCRPSHWSTRWLRW